MTVLVKVPFLFPNGVPPLARDDSQLLVTDTISLTCSQSEVDVLMLHCTDPPNLNAPVVRLFDHDRPFVFVGLRLNIGYWPITKSS